MAFVTYALLVFCLLQPCAAFAPFNAAAALVWRGKSQSYSRELLIRSTAYSPSAGARSSSPATIASRKNERKVAPHGSTSLSVLRASRWEPPTAASSGGDSDDADGVAYSVELPKATGISWGSDLSFRFVYVQEVEPNGAAAATAMVRKGDYLIGCDNTSLVAQDFNFVLNVRRFNCSPLIDALEMTVSDLRPVV